MMKQMIGFQLWRVAALALLCCGWSSGAWAQDVRIVNKRFMELYKQGKYAEAVPYAEQVVELVKKEYGTEHKDYGTGLNNLAELYNRMGEYDKALPLYLEALENAEKALGKSHSDYGRCLSNLAGLYYKISEYDKALPLCLEAKENAEKALGKSHPDYGTHLNNLAGLYRRMGEYDRALSLYLEAKENAEKTLGKSHPDYGTLLNNLAGLHESMGDYDRALPLYLEAKENTEKSLGKSHPVYGTRLFNLAGLYESMGNYAKALPLCLEAKENTEKALGKSHSDYGACLNNLAGLYKSMGDYDRALPLYLEAKENAEKALGKSHPDYGTRLNNLAGLHESMGDYDKALPLYLEAKENAEKALGKSHPVYGTRLFNLAGLYESMGNYAKALPLYLEAKENTEKALGKSHPDYGACLNNLAVLYYSMGQYDKALPLYLEAKENTEKTLGKSHPGYGACLNNLALLYQNMGNYDRALPLYLEAKENTEKALGKSHSDYGTCLNNLAVLYYIMGDYKALPLFFEAKENTEKTLGKSHPKYGTRLSNLAFLYYSMGQYDKALPLYLEAKENAEKVLGTTHPQYGVMLNNLAHLYHSTGDYDKTLPFFRESLQNNYYQLNQAFSFLSELGKEKFANKLTGDFEAYQSFFLNYQPQQPEVSGDAYDIELARKGMLLRAGIQMREAVKVGGDTATLALYDDWQGRRRIIAAEGNKPIAERRADLPALEAEAEKMERELAQRSAPFRENKRLGTARWQDVQARLQPGEVAIEFAAFQYRSAKRWTDSTQYMALLLRPGMAHPELIPLFEQRRLDSLLTKARARNSDKPSSLYHRGGTPVPDKPAHGKELYELVFAPIQSRLQAGDSVIYFSPAGGLHRVAFAALPIEGNKRLMDRYRLVQLGSTSELLREASSQLPAGADIVLFGGMDYQPDTLAWTAAAGKVPGMIPFGRSWRNELYKDMGPFEPLSGALSEVEAVARLARGKGLRVAKYTGTEALIERYMALSGAGSPGILHIATHGFYLPAPETKRNDRLLMTGNDMAASTDNPLRRSGLAFAGAEHTRRGRLIPAGVSGDGFLTAANAAHVPLPNTRLVVLAACKTALGDLSTGEGVYGLQRAFKAAGAEYLLLSLWNVPDKETGEFMELFYTRLFGGQTIEAAFEATRKEMKRLYENMPEIWGAFVLMR